MDTRCPSILNGPPNQLEIVVNRHINAPKAHEDVLVAPAGDLPKKELVNAQAILWFQHARCRQAHDLGNSGEEIICRDWVVSDSW